MPENSRGDYIIWSFNVSFWYILEVILGMIMVDNGSSAMVLLSPISWCQRVVGSLVSSPRVVSPPWCWWPCHGVTMLSTDNGQQQQWWVCTCTPIDGTHDKGYPWVHRYRYLWVWVRVSPLIPGGWPMQITSAPWTRWVVATVSPRICWGRKGWRFAVLLRLTWLTFEENFCLTTNCWYHRQSDPFQMQ